MKRTAERTLEVLRQRGWIKGAFKSGNGVCLRGAMMVAQSEDKGETDWLTNTNEPYPLLFGEYHALYQQMNDVLDEQFGSLMSVIEFNDAPGTELAEVIDLVERAGEL